MDILSYVTRNNISLEAASKEIGISPDTVFYHLNKLELKDVIAFFDKANKKTVKLRKRNVVVAIDFHDVPFYGDRNNQWVVGMKHKLGTNYCFRYATIEIVGKNKVTLHAIACNQFSDKAKIVKNLIDRARKYVDIELVLLDRGFFSSDVIKQLHQSKVNYLIPAKRDRRTERINKTVYGYRMKDVEFNLIVGLYKWTTNLTYVSSRLVLMYAGRWGIETGYRMKKDFKISTTTKDVIKRTLFFFIQVLCYNIWTIINASNGFGYYSHDEKYLTTRLFKVKVLLVT